jgi:CheY-like chemotaxis protein
VLDLMMPDRDGWELLSLLKTHPETAAIPVVVSSVLRQEELARALGAAAVLTKPFTPAQLLDTLRAAILSGRPDPGPAARSA